MHEVAKMDVALLRSSIWITNIFENTLDFQSQDSCFYPYLNFVIESFENCLGPDVSFCSKFENVDINVVLCYSDQRVLTPVVDYWGRMH